MLFKKNVLRIPCTIVFLLLLFCLTTPVYAAIIFSDNFDSTEIDLTKWTAVGNNIIQNGDLSIQGTNTWTSYNGILSKTKFQRGDSLKIDFKVKCSSTDLEAGPQVGFGDYNILTPNTEQYFVQFRPNNSGKMVLFLRHITTDTNGATSEPEYYKGFGTTPIAANTSYLVRFLLGDANGISLQVHNGEEYKTEAILSGGTINNESVFFAPYDKNNTCTVDNFLVSNDPISIKLTSPKQYQIFQRSATGFADIPISGIYSGSPSAVEASWNSGTWTALDLNPNSKQFSGVISNQKAGQGTLSVRFSNNHSVVSSADYVGIGDIYVIAGQSNASGRGNNEQTYSHPLLKAGLFGNDDTWKELADPVDNSRGQIDQISNDGCMNAGTCGSHWPLVATKLMADQNVPVAFVPTAYGGSSILEWQYNNSSSTLYGSMARRIRAVGSKIKAVLWWQGETDALNGMGREDYRRNINSFADKVYADFGAKTIVAQIGGFDRAQISNIEKIQLAQNDAWNENRNILRGPTFADVLPTADGVHFVTDSNMVILADRWWNAIKILYPSNTNTPPPASNPLPPPTKDPAPAITSSGGGGGSNTPKTTFANTAIASEPRDCLVGYKFSPSTGKICSSSSGVSTASVIYKPSGASYAFGEGLVKLGTKGEACKAWQLFLNMKLNARLATDGICGKLTIASAKIWQNRMGLKADGLLGAMSRAKALMQ